MPLRRLAEHPSSEPRSDERLVGKRARGYFYVVLGLTGLWFTLLLAGLIAVKSLVSLGSPEAGPSPMSNVETPVAAAPAVSPEGTESVAWHTLGLIALSCALCSLMIAQRLNPPQRRSLLRDRSTRKS